MKPSLTLILCGLFFAFILHSVWNLIGIFRSPVCVKEDKCYYSFLNTKPSLELYVYISDSSRYGNEELVFSDNKFEYMKSFEKYV